MTWFKDSKPIEEGECCRFLCLGDWYGLEILETHPNDAGIYTVMLDNLAGEVISSCTVDIKLHKADEEEDVLSVEKAGELSDRYFMTAYFYIYLIVSVPSVKA